MSKSETTNSTIGNTFFIKEVQYLNQTSLLPIGKNLSQIEYSGLKRRLLMGVNLPSA
ncbi:MAG: hypothetical protein IPO37_14550 [Saprospiraceae bacterium]|nr:hypothetical protein [Saprospiraceae bacterium]